MFGFPVAQRTSDFVLRQNLLKTVVFQIRFLPIPGISARFEELSKLLSDAFPEAQERKHQEFALQFVDKTPIISPAGPSDTNALVVTNASKQKVFSIKEDELTLVVGEADYVNFGHIQETLDKSIYRIAYALQLKELERVSIRKINILAFSIEINFPTELLYKVVYQNLLTLTGTSIPAAKYLYSGVSNYRFVKPPHRLDLVYGITPEPGPDNTREFVLDIDLLLQEKSSFSDLKSNFKQINDEVFNVFNWSINPNFLDTLNKTS